MIVIYLWHPTIGLAQDVTPSPAPTVPTAQSVAVDRAENSGLLGIPVQDEAGIIARMNQAATYASEARLSVMNGLYSAPVKTKLQSMTCLDKILLIRYIGLTKISFQAIIDTIIQVAVMALLQALCSLIDAAWDSAVNKLTAMATINLGSGTSVSLIQGNGNSITIGNPVVTSSNPYISSFANAAIQNSPNVTDSINLNPRNPGQTSSVASPSGAGYTHYPTPAPSTMWEGIKKIFK